jgi:hypothetical protein
VFNCKRRVPIAAQRETLRELKNRPKICSAFFGQALRKGSRYVLGTGKEG